MKILIKSLLFIAIFIASSATIKAEGELSSYFKVGTLNVSMDDAIASVKEALATKKFEVIGEYHPAEKPGLYVVAYTRDDLQQTTLQVKDRGALASVLKIGFVEKDGKIVVSMLNPMYLFYAYLMDDADNYQSKLKSITDDAKAAMSNVGTDFTPFGGGEEADDLKDYHYMMMMPYFTDPEELNEFDSFEEGLSVIRKNLAAKKGNTLNVYELVFENEKVAIFGVGLYDEEEGEAHFLPIIGEDHVAAMPYEIILQGKEATMLHGKYRFALHWPELTMGQFMKISSTPGDVEDFLEALTE
ncbi:MAG: hypothetical protein B6D61_07980 [Bacteroidetes bacterium 4484_249]|nr:MAG: hypothetical protein B6D61_07980 [Bacteroidetes bacterium 4484_249]